MNKYKQIVHYTSPSDHKRANSAYLVASYAVLYLNKSPREAYNTLFMGGDVPIKPFQDASMGVSIYNIHILGDKLLSPKLSVFYILIRTINKPNLSYFCGGQIV